MINLKIPNYSKEVYISYWAKLNCCTDNQSGNILKGLNGTMVPMDYEGMCEFLDINMSKCKAFIKEAGEKGIMLITSYDTNGKIKYDFCFTAKYIVNEVEGRGD
jgi:hypothetical protein